MNCEDVANRLDNGLSVDSAQTQDGRLGEHLVSCRDCQDAWRASRMLRSFAATPAQSARAGVLEEMLHLAAARSRRSHRRPRSFWLGGALGAALAASITLVAVLGIRWPSRFEHTEPPPSFAIALYESRDITFAINSAESLANARIHVGLKGGVELAGRAGQQDIHWTADIGAGINRLTIPVVAVSNEDAEVRVEVEHGQRHRAFLVQLDVVSAVHAAAPTKS